MGERDDGLGLSLSLGNNQQKEPSLRLNLMPLTTISTSSSSFPHMHNQNNNSHPQKTHPNSWTHLFQSSGNIFFSLFSFIVFFILNIQCIEILFMCKIFEDFVVLSYLRIYVSDPILIISFLLKMFLF